MMTHNKKLFWYVLACSVCSFFFSCNQPFVEDTSSPQTVPASLMAPKDMHGSNTEPPPKPEDDNGAPHGRMPPPMEFDLYASTHFMPSPIAIVPPAADEADGSEQFSFYSTFFTSKSYPHPERMHTQGASNKSPNTFKAINPSCNFEKAHTMHSTIVEIAGISTAFGISKNMLTY